MLEFMLCLNDVSCSREVSKSVCESVYHQRPVSSHGKKVFALSLKGRLIRQIIVNNTEESCIFFGENLSNTTVIDSYGQFTLRDGVR